MYVIKDNIDLEELKKYNFKRYLNGYSRMMRDPDYRFIDILDKDRIVKKAKYENGKFVYDLVDGYEIMDLIAFSLVEEVLDD